VDMCHAVPTYSCQTPQSLSGTTLWGFITSHFRLAAEWRDAGSVPDYSFFAIEQQHLFVIIGTDKFRRAKFWLVLHAVIVIRVIATWGIFMERPISN